MIPTLDEAPKISPTIRHPHLGRQAAPDTYPEPNKNLTLGISEKVCFEAGMSWDLERAWLPVGTQHRLTENCRVMGRT